MTKQETVMLMELLHAAYPGFYKDQTRQEKAMAIELWADMFQDKPGPAVAAAVKALIAGDTKGFPPHIGAVCAYLQKITAPPGMTESEAWSLIERAVANSAYESQKEFDRLPEDLRHMVGSPSQLHAWSQMARADFDTVVGSHIRRSFRDHRQRQQELAMLPAALRTGPALQPPI